MILKEWNFNQIAKGYGYSSKEEYIKDLHVPSLSKFSETTLAKLVGGEVTTQGVWDVTVEVPPKGRHWSERIEIRGLGNNNVYFNPSTDNGANRPFVLENFEKKLSDITSYVFFDYRDLLNECGDVKLYEIPVEIVKQYWEEGKLGTRTSISVRKRKKDNKSQFDDLFPYEDFKLIIGEKNNE
tara:strand:- start:170 stop:718 length:549 start_codon:yes stop_codon:yes gene_type:complete